MFKITREKWTGNVTEVVECLLCKCEALTSNPSSTKKKKKGREKKKKEPVFSLHIISEKLTFSSL
jgi:hypothetical protein